MNRSVILFWVFLPLLSVSLQAENAISHYWEAAKLKKSNKTAEAYALFDQVSRESVEEKNPMYQWYASYNACYCAYRLRKYPETVRHAKLALAVISEHQDEKWALKLKLQLNRVELLGMVERGSSIMLKFGQGWDYNRRAIAALQKLSGMPVDIRGIDPKEVAKLPVKYRILGWRLIGRDAYYLHSVGRSDEARELLNQALILAESDQRSSSMALRRYGIQLFNQLGLMESFIGYKARANALYEKEAELLKLAGFKHRKTYLIAKINLIANDVDLYGASDESIKSAQAILKEVESNGEGRALGVRRLVIKIERNRLDAHQRIARLEKLSQENEEADDLMESFFTARNALFSRGALGEKKLDQQYITFLEQARKRGEKRVEPRIYRRYGDWLSSQNRYADALVVYKEALRMSSQFGWHPGVLYIQAKLGAAYLANGQVAEAVKMWSQMDEYQAEHPDIPTYAILQAWSVKLLALLRAKRGEEALRLAAQANELGGSGRVSAMWLVPFQDRIITKYLSEVRVVATSNDKQESKPAQLAYGVTLQPMTMSSVILPSQDTKVSFYLINRGADDVTGRLLVTGRGVELSAESEEGRPVFVCDAGEKVREIGVDLTVPGGSLIEVPFSMGLIGDDPSHYQINWSPEDGEGSQSDWQISKGEEAKHSLVLNAARLGLSPFVGVPVLHYVGFSAQGADSKGFRLRSQRPVRIEYRDPATSNLLAVDDNGNGDFLDEGDFFPPEATQKNQVSAPRVYLEEGEQIGAMEVWIYPRSGHSWGLETIVFVELYNPVHGWEEYARNVLEDAP